MTTTLLVVVALRAVSAFQSRTPLRMSAGAAELDALRSQLVAKINGVVPLSAKADHAENLGAAVVNEAVAGSCDGYLGLPKVGWCSATRLDSGGASYLHLSAQVAPNYDVPHLTLDLVAEPAGVRIAYDLTAREDVVGNKNYVESYYSQVEPWFDAAQQRCTLVPNTAGIGMRSLASPVSLNAVTDSVASAAQIATDLVDTWASWLSSPTEINRMKRGTAYARDTAMHKQRWMHYCAVVKGLSGGALSDQRAAEIASALAGPGDEAYTGGGGGSAEGV